MVFLLFILLVPFVIALTLIAIASSHSEPKHKPKKTINDPHIKVPYDQRFLNFPRGPFP